MNCTICHKPIALIPSAADRARKFGGRAKEYTLLFTEHARCTLVPEDKMKPKLRQIATFGPHTNEIGIVSAIRKDGFYVRHTTGFPTIPGGRKAAYSSRFFPFNEINDRGFQGEGVTLCGK